ncbi:hypothetical protein Tco_1293342 [Tanacetum coccineum]|uniref:Uncharacterized protein n=1 Tax=Tanacetum coccineum TaxID=301880 RepID=A0ABQ4WD33_9ASTR
MIGVAILVRLCERRDVRWGWKVIFVGTPLKKGDIRDDSVLVYDGLIKDCMEKIWKMMLLYVSPEKDSIIAPPSYTPGNDFKYCF